MPRGPGVGTKYNDVVIFRLRIFQLRMLELKHIMIGVYMLMSYAMLMSIHVSS